MFRRSYHPYSGYTPGLSQYTVICVQEEPPSLLWLHPWVVSMYTEKCVQEELPSLLWLHPWAVLVHCHVFRRSYHPYSGYTPGLPQYTVICFQEELPPFLWLHPWAVLIHCDICSGEATNPTLATPLGCPNTL